jgi:hypothetical protein
MAFVHRPFECRRAVAYVCIWLRRSRPTGRARSSLTPGTRNGRSRGVTHNRHPGINPARQTYPWRRAIRPRLVLLEISGDQGHPFVWRGRAWKRVGRRSHYEQSAIRHALQLSPQRQRLPARLPGMRHHLHSCFVIALDLAGTDRRADRHDQTVIGERRTAAKPHGLSRRIDRRREA